MLALDVTVLVTALRPDAEHQATASWLEDAAAAPEPVGISDVVLSGAARVLTHRRIFDPPSAVDDVLTELSRLRAADGVVTLVPGSRHWTIFESCAGRPGPAATSSPTPLTRPWPSSTGPR